MASEPDATLLDFIFDTRWQDLSGPVQHQARRCFLDTAGVAIAGSQTPLAQVVRDFSQAHMAGDEARLLASHSRLSALGAALAGGLIVDAFDAHDGHRLCKGHAGAALVPALFVFADLAGLQLEETEALVHLAVGYEVALRAGVALHDTASDYHTSGAWVCLGVVALGARILGLSRVQTWEALGIAEYHGPRSPMMRCIDFPTMVKDGAGKGAQTGVEAVLLARHGFTGAPAETLAHSIFASLGSRWMILEQYFKPWPVCRWAQPAVQAAAKLRAEHGFASEDIDAIRLESFHEAVRLAVRIPANTEEAQYATPWPLAVMLAKGKLGADAIDPSSFQVPELQHLAHLVELVDQPDYSAAFPAERFARLELRLKDGRVLDSGRVEAEGDPESPLSDAELLGKYSNLTGQEHSDWPEYDAIVARLFNPA